MVFPSESEERVRRRALSVCQDHLRMVTEIARKVMLMIDSFVKDNETSTKEFYVEIQTLGEELNDVRRKVFKELTEIGGLLRNREDFLRFVNQTSDISDFCIALGFRLLVIIKRRWKGSKEVKNGLVNLSERTFETVQKLRETVITLNYSSTKTLEKAREVRTVERIVDDLYRELEIKILNSDLEIPILLLLRDITQLLEDISDKAEDASDAACVLSFVM